MAQGVIEQIGELGVALVRLFLLLSCLWARAKLTYIFGFSPFHTFVVALWSAGLVASTRLCL